MTVKIKYQHTGIHTKTQVFVGTDVDHLAWSGDLYFRNEEWAIFRGVMEHADTSRAMTVLIEEKK